MCATLVTKQKPLFIEQSTDKSVRDRIFLFLMKFYFKLKYLGILIN